MNWGSNMIRIAGAEKCLDMKATKFRTWRSILPNMISPTASRPGTGSMVFPWAMAIWAP